MIGVGAALRARRPAVDPDEEARRPPPGALRGSRPGTLFGVAVAIVSVTLATLAVFALAHVARPASLSVVYLPAVLLVATYWGLRLGVLTALLSAAAFNFFHLPPTGQFTIADSRNWVALAAFVVVALVAGTIADLARGRALEAERRRAEADLAAALSRELLLGADTAGALATAARRVAEALGLRSAAIELGVSKVDRRRVGFPLPDADGHQLATLLVPAGLPPADEQRLRTQVVPALSALVAIATRRDDLHAEAVETAALRRSDDIKTALLRAVSHDLRTPLTSVVAAGHALGTDALTDDERHELSATVVEEGTRLAVLVEKLLDLSRLQAGAIPSRRDWVAVEEVVESAAEGLRSGPADVRLIVDADVPELQADAAQLERAFANLFENAGRYSSGPISVHVRHAGSRVVISVVDTGPGIAPAEHARIFEPFYRGRAGQADGWTGSGLGLAITRGFVEANGGTIEVESLPGQGTTFVISLAAGETAGEEPLPTSSG